jgi:hypothetical protein
MNKKSEARPAQAPTTASRDTNGYTGNSVLHRTEKNTPSNEGRLRGIVYLPRYKLPLLRALATEKQIQAGIDEGGLVLVD